MKKILLSLLALTGFCISAMTQPGSLDSTFNPGSGPSMAARTTAMQADGKILIGGDFTSYNGNPINRLARIIAEPTSGKD